MKQLHEHGTPGDMQWNHGLQTDDHEKCPLDEVIVVDTAVVNTVKCKQKYWIEPSCLAADREPLTGTLQWGVP
eukprot:2322131-Prorocentrum_lima.AAC.1